MTVDWVSGNIYWTDTGLNRIEVSRCDGSSRRVLIWKDLNNPASIAIDPASGSIYWSTWSDVSVIERAAMDGSGRTIFVTDVGKTNGLTIDFQDRRLYWTDIDKQSISYAPLTTSGKAETSKMVLKSESAQLYGLSMYKNNVYWTDLKGRTIERADKETGLSRFVVQSEIDDVVDILIYHESRQVGTNPCEIDNGGCPDLCLFVRGKVQCACPSHLFPSKTDPKDCIKPDQFLLFSQKNKMSRLYMDDQHPEEVPDLALPIYGARDIQSIGYDPTDRLIYWIDYGSKKKPKHYISIRRAHDNGTLLDRIFHGSNFRPYDLAVDPYARLLFWSCEQTNAINVTRIDIEDPEESVVGSILGGNEDQPRSIAIHPQMRSVKQPFIKYVKLTKFI
jgi:low density lipoprotein receptor-related protein 5/6